MESESGKISQIDTPAAISAAATAEVLEKAPVGTLFHRTWTCKTLDGPRLEEAHPQDISRTKAGWGTGDPAWERALAPMPPLPSRKRSEHETFHWVVRPPDGILPPGDVYVDGSALDGPYRQLIRCGWAFVMINRRGDITAAARGGLPPGSTTLAERKAGLSCRLRCTPSLARTASSPTVSLE